MKWFGRQAALQTCWLLSACAGEQPSVELTADCIADPVDHDVAPTSCVTIDDCPSGTRCISGSPELLDETPVCWPNAVVELGEDGLSHSCQLTDEAPAPDSRSLRRGFGVGKLEMSIESDHLGSFVSWQRPQDAGLVWCAMFGCVPEFSTSRSGDRLEHVVTNYDRCVIADFSSELPADAWYFDGASRQAPASASCAVRRVHVDGLWIGCWAYDDFDILAASDLQTIDVTEPLDYPGIYTADCDGIVDGAACVRAPGEALGICIESQCRERCVVTADCTHAPERLPVNATAAFEELVCGCCADCGIGGCVPRKGSAW